MGRGGGAGPGGPQETASANVASHAGLPLGPAGLIQLRVRVIALENLVIALLAEACGPQRMRASQMAAFILPRPGFTPHPLTVQAAARMTDLAERARPFQGLLI